MELTTASKADVAYAKRLLHESGLPTDVEREDVSLFVGRVGDRQVGVCGLETRGSSALVRSVAMEPKERRAGYGTALVERLLGRARERGIREVYLLTEDATGFFEGVGFERIEREGVPETIRETPEFTTLCPASATCLWRALG